MILYKCLILIVLLNSFVKTEKNIKYCFYSRYMYYALKLHDINFGKSLKHQGQTVLLILDDLITQKENQLSSLPEDMMAINLYLNNVSNTLLVQTYDGVNEKDYMKNLFKLLENSIKKNCHFRSLPVFGYGEEINYYEIIQRVREDHSTLGDDELSALLPEKFSLNDNCRNSDKTIEEHMDVYYDSVLEMKYLLKPIWNRQKYMRYHPRQMLLYDVLSRDEYHFAMEGKPDQLELLQNVTFGTKLNNGSYPDIGVLFSKARRVYDFKCLKSFQQQVLVATAHPVLSIIRTYLGLFKNMFYTGDNKFKNVSTRVELFEKKINDLGDSILNTFVSFIRLNLYPKKALKYLKKTILELDDLVKHNNKKDLQWVAPELIGQIFRRCSKPLLLNNIQVSEDYISVISEENCDYSINELKLKVDKVGIYVKDLEKYKKFYHQIIWENSIFSQEDMFVAQPTCDLI